MYLTYSIYTILRTKRKEGLFFNDPINTKYPNIALVDHKTSGSGSILLVLRDKADWPGWLGGTNLYWHNTYASIISKKNK